MPDGGAYQLNPRVSGGHAELVTVSNPATGASGWSYTLPAGYTYEIVAISTKLVTDANAASRTNFVYKVTDASAVELGRTFSAATVAASKTAQISAHTGYEGGATSINDVAINVAIPVGGGTRLLPGWILALTYTANQVGDQLSDIVLTVIRRPYPN